MDKKAHINKEDFLSVMKSMNAKQMQQYIESKGKDPKVFNPIMHDRKYSL